MPLQIFDNVIPQSSRVLSLHSLYVILGFGAYILVCIQAAEHSTDTNNIRINSFDDNILFRINWSGKSKDDNSDIKSSSQLENYEDENSLWITTVDNEKYRCTLPSTVNANSDESLKYDGPTALKLLSPLFETSLCSYRLEQYWAYELCHGQFIRQYHEESAAHRKNIQEFILGKYDAAMYDLQTLEQQKLEASWKAMGRIKVPTLKLEGLDMPYLQINMTDGTLCDVTGEYRSTRVLYVCAKEAKHEMYSIKETASCEYEIIVLSPLLCSHPAYKSKSAYQNEIKCVPRDMSPPKPLRLLEWEEEARRTQQGLFEPFTPIAIPKKEEEEETLSSSSSASSTTSTHATTPPPSTDSEATLSPDPELTKRFLSGDYCLHGGSGWWKYEFCYGKKVEQYHEERNGLKTTILLGKWDKQEHLAWLAKNPHKKPNMQSSSSSSSTSSSRPSISHFYSQGSYCDEAKKPRHVEVKLKCKENKGHPDSVSLYILEPKICEYVLGVESPFLCPLLSKVDENGLIDTR